MKIGFEFDDKYKQIEIHICNSEKTKEVIGLRELLEDVLDKRVTVHKNQEAKTLPTHEIIRIFSENKKVFLRTLDDTYEVRDRLYSLEEKLDNRSFVRISNSEIVNISQIEKLDMSYSGTIKMCMKNGDTTFVSRRYVSRIKEVLSREGQ